jgi:hypothetical protein
MYTLRVDGEFYLISIFIREALITFDYLCQTRRGTIDLYAGDEHAFTRPALREDVAA